MICLKSSRKKPIDFEPRTLGEQIKRRRLEIGLTQKLPGEILGVTLLNILNWEKAKMQPLSEFIHGIANFSERDPCGYRTRVYRSGETGARIAAASVLLDPLGAEIDRTDALQSVVPLVRRSRSQEESITDPIAYASCPSASADWLRSCRKTIGWVV